MLQHFNYYASLLRLRYLTSRQDKNRYEFYNPNESLDKPELCGSLENVKMWRASSPSLESSENYSIIASNTFNKTAIKLLIKWRPDKSSGLTTLVNTLSFEVDGDIYDFDEVVTYAPNRSALNPDFINRWGSNNSSIRLTIIAPYKRYRLVFRGYMRNRQKLEEVKFVKLNLLILMSTKPYDFGSMFDECYVATQLAKKNPKCGFEVAVNTLICHDRHECLAQVKGEYVISDGDEKKKEDKVFVWGFHSRQFITDETQKLRTKRLLGYTTIGKAFHLGVIESVDNNYDESQRMHFGYAAIDGLKVILRSLTNYIDSSPEWDKITSDSMQIDFKIEDYNENLKIAASRRQVGPTEFFDMECDNKQGWLIFQVNDALDSTGTLIAIQRSLEEYKKRFEEKRIIDFSTISQDLNSNEKPLIVSIDEKKHSMASVVGAKASSLALMNSYASRHQDACFEVSKAITLTRFAYDLLMTSNEEARNKVEQMISKISQGQVIDLAQQCEHVQSMIAGPNTSIPLSLEEALKKKLKSTFSINDIESLDGRLFAVRSSAWGEDEEGMSAAGQLTTCLNVTGFVKLVDAIKVCFASKFSYTNIEYKRQHGVPLDMPMAVVIQEMIDCDKAGVLFTCDPKSYDLGHFTITASYGLGEIVVSAQADPDFIKVRVSDDKHDIVAKTIGLKEVYLTSDGPDATNNEQGSKDNDEKATEHSEQQTRNIGEHSSQQTEVKTYDKSKCCMDDEEIARLTNSSRLLRDFFRDPRDIEFGFKNDKLYFFQSRPVTGLDSYSEYEMLHEFDSPSRSESLYATRANICEVMPYAVTPMFLSYSVANWGILGNRLLMNWRKINKEEFAPYLATTIKIESYHAFFSLQESEMFMGTEASGEKDLLAKAMEIGLLGHEIEDPEILEVAKQCSRSPIKYSYWYYQYHALEYQLYPHARIARTRKMTESLKTDVQLRRYLKNDSLEEFYKQIMYVLKFSQQVWKDHFVVIFEGSQANVILLCVLSKYIQDPTDLYVTLAKILSATPDVLSAEIPARIEKIANMIKKRDEKEVASFASMSNEDAFKFITSSSNDGVANEFNEFIEKFGHRCYNEFEFRSKTWQENPLEIIEKLKQNVKSPVSEPRSKESVDHILDSLNVNLSAKDKAALKYKIIPNAQSLVSAREKTKDAMILFVSIQRLCLQMLAEALRKHNRIPDDDLLHFVSVNELNALIREPQPAVIMQALKRRRLYRLFDAEWRFDEIIKGYEFIPHHLAQKAEIDASLLNAPRLTGVPASSGVVKGKVCIVKNYTDLNKVKYNEILVAHSTDIAFSPIFPLICGIVTEMGGLISHGAVVAREYGLPCVLGVTDATQILQDGEEVLLDANSGCVIRLGLSENKTD